SRREVQTSYPYSFIIVIAAVALLGHAVRGIVYQIDPPSTSLLDPTPWNLFFLSVGSQLIPTVSLGAMMMVHGMMVARAEHAANRDFLTGAWSRRAFFSLADREVVRARRTDQELALLLIDIDHFKNINDSHGHAIGDQVLVDMVL